MRYLGAKGVLVLTVKPGGAADKAGLRPTRQDPRGRILIGDLIVSTNGNVVNDSKELFQILDSHDIGDKITLRVRRTDGELDLDVILQAEP